MKDVRFRKNQDGQISIMLALMMSTFIIFFAFVINIGMLVNAKINIQNAADLAAYSGAAVQARQLTGIAHLNYEMRRQYKKFIFRYYVIGNMAQKSMSQQSGPRKWAPDGIKDYGAPAVCIIFNPTDNICQLASLKQIDIPPKSAMDSINDTLISSLKAIESLRQDNCLAAGKLNRQVLLFWLWNTDPDLGFISSQVQNDPELGKTLSLLKGLNYGLGLVPKEVLVRERIRTLTEYVNAPAESQVTYDKLRNMMQDPDMIKHERTINAFQSAYETLGNHTFDDTDSIILDELIPGSEGSSGQATLLKLKDHTISFTTYYVDYSNKGTITSIPGGPAKPPRDCEGDLVPMPVQFPMPIGVSKDPSVITYYAIRLKAKAKLMFSPWGDLTLKAYAAARPFGSRIGPPDIPTSELKWGKDVPGLPITGAATDWADMTNMQKYYGILTGVGVQGGGNGSIVGFQDMDRAYQAAMAPNPYEKGKWSIPNDFPDTYFPMVNPKDNYYRFWAPVISKKKEIESGGDYGQIVRKLLDQAMSALAQSAMQLGAPPPPNMTLLGGALAQGLTKYINALKAGRGEYKESYSFAALSNPLKLAPGAGVPAQPIPLTGVFWDKANEMKNSWKSEKDGVGLIGGRSGYSVKIIAFQEIMKSGGVLGDGGTPMTNTMKMDGEADVDLGGPIEH